ncbi:MAG TPA: acetylglucosaminyldiphospho-UDP acetyl-beta-D-mannosaminyltransferase, partial [Methylococcaceae bacterium]|nr:acetylglucosaminyldiphospho-UDP acetyl-beta-D-mannosaminyltransferase [Methylococcaceae bacterium]
MPKTMMKNVAVFSTQENEFSRNVWSILGLPFDLVSLQDACSVTNRAIANKQRCFLTTPNLNFLITAQSDEAFFQSVMDSDLSVADGMPIIWVAKLLGIPLPERVAGSDLFAGLSQQKQSDKKISVFF